MNRIHDIDALEWSLVEVRFKGSHADPSLNKDTLVVEECPYCEGEHEHSLEPRVVYGGIGISVPPCSPQDVPQKYYLLLREDGTNLPYDVIHYARREVTNESGDSFNRPLIPKGVEPRVIDDLLSGWGSD